MGAGGWCAPAAQEAGRRSIAGSGIGGISETQVVLDFCAEHGIGADAEVIGAEQINEAYERVLRYRFVIDNATIRPSAGASRSSRGRQDGRPPHDGKRSDR